MKCSVYERKDIPVAELFFRETEICEWFFESPVKHVFALKNGNTINAVLDHECGGVSTLELAAVSSVYYMLLGTDDKEDIASRHLRLTKLTDEVMKKLESGIAEVTV